jgi:hypothetical protein
MPEMTEKDKETLEITPKDREIIKKFIVSIARSQGYLIAIGIEFRDVWLNDKGHFVADIVILDGFTYEPIDICFTREHLLLAQAVYKQSMEDAVIRLRDTLVADGILP